MFVEGSFRYFVLFYSQVAQVKSNGQRLRKDYMVAHFIEKDYRYFKFSIMLFCYYYYIRQLMGQEQSKSDTPNKIQSSAHNSLITTARKAVSIDVKKIERVQCEGLLKLRATPFKNSVEIVTDQEVLFLQNVQTTLKQLLEVRLNTNKLFMVEDIERLIEEVAYTLAFLQQKNITYKDVSSETIYYDSGNFKLLPNQLIETSTYQKLRQGLEVCPSPELIIGLRCGEEDVVDEDIVQKSNVFTLGMILLEVTTLLPSLECYDAQSYDILDGVINQRLVLVEEYYGSKISKIIANMLDYDYTERMGFKQLSIWINRQLQQSRSIKTQSEPNMMPSIVTSKVQKQSQVKMTQLTTQSQAQFSNQKARNKLAKNNSVYMGYNRECQGAKQEKNKIYINDNSSRSQEMQGRGFPQEQVPSYPRKRNQITMQNPQREIREIQRYHPNNNISFNESQSFKINEYVRQELKHPNPYCEDFKFPAKKQQVQQRSPVQRQTTKRVAKEGLNPYRYQQQNRYESKEKEPSAFDYIKKDKAPLREVSNQFYPNIQDILKGKSPQNNLEIKGPMGQNGALNRIKQQILKSRKLIQQFKKSEGLKF